MNGSLNLAAVRAVAAAALRIVSTMYFHNLTAFILDTAGALYKICIHQAHFVAGEHTEILLGRFFHEVFSLNI